jgi:hypothetical protein
MATDKILFAELADNEIFYRYFPFFANVWGVNTRNDYTGIAAPEFNLEAIGLNRIEPVISYSVRKEPYIAVSSVPEVIANTKTFFWDQTNNQLYIHYENHKPPYFFRTTELEIGFTIGFIRSPKNISGVFNDIQYFNRLKTAPIFSERKDDIYFGKQSFAGSALSFVDNDLRFKNFNLGINARKRNGAFVRARVWEGEDAELADYNDSVITYQGVIEKTSEGVDVNISLRDIRTTLTTKSPNRYLDNSLHPFLKDPDKSEILPQVWGKCFSVPVLCLNENVNKGIDPPPVGVDVPVNFDFMICDTNFHNIATDAIKKVFVNGTEITNLPTVTFNANELYAGFTLPSGVFEDVETDDLGDVSSIRYRNMSRVTIDVYGYIDAGDSHLIENGLEVIRTIIADNLQKPFTSTFYDVTTWNTFEALAYDVGYFIKKPLTTQQQIQELQNAQLGTFIWDQNLKFSFGNDDFDGFVGAIDKNEFFGANFTPTFSSDGTRVLSKFRIGYQRKWDTANAEDRHTWLVDDSNSETALLKFNSEFEKDFITILTDSTQVEDYARRVLDIGGTSFDTFTFTTKWDSFTLKAGDWVTVEADYLNEEYLGLIPAQVFEMTPNLDNWTIRLKLRIFPDKDQFILANNGESLLANNGEPLFI